MNETEKYNAEKNARELAKTRVLDDEKVKPFVYKFNAESDADFERIKRACYAELIWLQDLIDGKELSRIAKDVIAKSCNRNCVGFRHEIPFFGWAISFRYFMKAYVVRDRYETLSYVYAFDKTSARQAACASKDSRVFCEV